MRQESLKKAREFEKSRAGSCLEIFKNSTHANPVFSGCACKFPLCAVFAAKSELEEQLLEQMREVQRAVQRRGGSGSERRERGRRGMAGARVRRCRCHASRLIVIQERRASQPAARKRNTTQQHERHKKRQGRLCEQQSSAAQDAPMTKAATLPQGARFERAQHSRSHVILTWRKEQ